MSKKLKVAVLDSGLDTTTYFQLFNEHITEGYSLCVNENSNEIKEKEFEDFNGHGTACAVKIKELAEDVTIVPIKILQDDGRGSTKWLLKALELVSELDVQIVNMSISSDIVELKQIIKPLLRKLKHKGIICIAAKSNSRKVSIPAEMNDVIGVGSSKDIFGTHYQYCEKKSIEIIASGAPELLGYENKMNTFFKGNSRATAVFTGVIANYISKNGMSKSEEDLTRYLRRNSIKVKEQLYGLDMTCKDNSIKSVVANTISKLIQEDKINITLENSNDLDYSESTIEDFYKIVLELENVFECNIFRNATVYMKYFQTIECLSKLVEDSRK